MLGLYWRERFPVWEGLSLPPFEAHREEIRKDGQRSDRENRNMTHAIQWFFSSGIHDPAWVQAVAAIALVVLTIVTLIVLAFYAWDTHTLAKTSVHQAGHM